MFLRQVEVLRGLGERIQQAQVRRLWHKCPRSPVSYPFLWHIGCGKETHQIGHGLKLDTAGHAARGSGFLDTRFIGFGKDPDGVVRVTEDPEIVATNVRELLQIALVDTRAMQGVDELVG
jgi:hypothetical protein